MEMKFYICKHCGNIIAFAKNSGVPVMCCGEKMQEITPNTTDAAQEKHVPVVTVDGNCVTVEVGSVPHPIFTDCGKQKYKIRYYFIRRANTLRFFIDMFLYFPLKMIKYRKMLICEVNNGTSKRTPQEY